MTADTLRDRLAEAAAGAAQDVPGVAFLRPGVVDLLRTRVAGRAPRPAGGSGARPQGCG